MARQRQNKLAMIVPGEGGYSETFIRAQLEHLPFHITLYSSGFFPTKCNHQPFISRRFHYRMMHKITSKLSLTKLTLPQEQLARSFKKNKIEVVLAQFGPTGEAVAKVCKVLRIPLVVHFHGADASVGSLIAENNHYQSVIKNANKVVVVSQEMLKMLLDLGFPQEKLLYNVYGPRDTFLQLKNNNNKPIFFSAGRFTDKKAPYYTILAFADVQKEFPESQLIMGGDGVLLEACKNLVKFLGLEKKVVFPGVLTQQQIMDYLGNCLAFVQHSIQAINGDMEGTPLSVLEASAAGVAVISTRHAGIKDVIIDNETGLLVDEHDVKAMSAAMKKLLEVPYFACELGSRGKERIKNKFSMDKHIEGLSKIIYSTLDEN